MTSVKVKFRPSTVTGKMGSIYYQVIHGRMVRQISTNYKILVSEWNQQEEYIVDPPFLSKSFFNSSKYLGKNQMGSRTITQNYSIA